MPGDVGIVGSANAVAGRQAGRQAGRPYHVGIVGSTNPIAHNAYTMRQCCAGKMQRLWVVGHVGTFFRFFSCSTAFVSIVRFHIMKYTQFFLGLINK